MHSANKRAAAAVLALASLAWIGVAGADNGRAPQNHQPCPVTPYDSTTSMDDEFGYGAQAITRCLQVRRHAKVVVSVDHAFFVNAFGAAQTNRATFLSNIHHMVANYENVHGMTIGKDVEVVVVFSESGAVLAATHHRCSRRRAAAIRRTRSRVSSSTASRRASSSICARRPRAISTST